MVNNVHFQSRQFNYSESDDILEQKLSDSYKPRFGDFMGTIQGHDIPILKKQKEAASFETTSLKHKGTIL